MEFDDFKTRLQTAFTRAVVAKFGCADAEPIPSDDDIEASFRGPRADILHVVHEGEPVGGAVVSLNEDGTRGSLGFFFLDESSQGKGLGYAAWRAIEKRYSVVRLWETATSYFEKRNIHFYINKCGFHIVEFFHPGHPDPHGPKPVDEEQDYMFRFEKVV